jgi:hypothetical protein
MFEIFMQLTGCKDLIETEKSVSLHILTNGLKPFSSRYTHQSNNLCFNLDKPGQTLLIWSENL